MPKKFTPAQISLAKELFAKAHASGTLKQGIGLIATTMGQGGIKSASSPVTWRDYLRDARTILE